jgi:hypothetical protein
MDSDTIHGLDLSLRVLSKILAAYLVSMSRGTQFLPVCSDPDLPPQASICGVPFQDFRRWRSEQGVARIQMGQPPSQHPILISVGFRNLHHRDCPRHRLRTGVVGPLHSISHPG